MKDAQDTRVKDASSLIGGVAGVALGVSNPYTLAATMLAMQAQTMAGEINYQKSVNKFNKQFMNPAVNETPYGSMMTFELGGLPDVGMMSKAIRYRGNKHKDGGIKVGRTGLPVPSSNVEVEGGEVMVNILPDLPFVFSNKLKL